MSERNGEVRLTWDQRIPTRGGPSLSATLYLPSSGVPAPAIVAITPYVAQRLHAMGMYLAARGLPFVAVDSRGRGNSEGSFEPFVHEAEDGFEVVEWAAGQDFCSGKVAMFGGSYSGYNQWATARARSPSLAAIVPTAAGHPGVDFPMRNNIPYPYAIQWLCFTAGKANQEALFADEDFWAKTLTDFARSGRPFRELDEYVGFPSAAFQSWADHPQIDAFWDALNPTQDDYARIDIPVLTITGTYDADQPGALTFYDRHQRHAPPAARSQHHLIIGPWDHAGTQAPQASFGGLTFGPDSVLDMPALHREWYGWTLEGGPKPAFLQDRVAYYVAGSERWRYAPSLEEVTAAVRTLFLNVGSCPADAFASGRLVPEPPTEASTRSYRSDPRDEGPREADAIARLGPPAFPPTRLTDQHHALAARSSALIFHSEPFAEAVEISGFVRLHVWLSIDQPDTDFDVRLFEILADGGSIFLTSDQIRARYRDDQRTPAPVPIDEPVEYRFENFLFVSRQIARGSRLRMMIGPINSIYAQRNFNDGGDNASRDLTSARAVNVTLVQQPDRPNKLHLPIGHDIRDSQ